MFCLHLYLCTIYMSYVQSPERGCSIPLNWTCRQLWANTCVLGARSWSFAKVICTVNWLAIFPVPLIQLLKWTNTLPLNFIELDPEFLFFHTSLLPNTCWWVLWACRWPASCFSGGIWWQRPCRTPSWITWTLVAEVWGGSGLDKGLMMSSKSGVRSHISRLSSGLSTERTTVLFTTASMFWQVWWCTWQPAVSRKMDSSASGSNTLSQLKKEKKEKKSSDKSFLWLENRGTCIRAPVGQFGDLFPFVKLRMRWGAERWLIR